MRMQARPSGKEILMGTKAAAGGEAELRIPVGEPPEASLRPVATVAGRTRPDDVRRLTRWRNRHVTAFLTEFEATEERTARWLEQVVGPDPTRILFMVDDAGGRTVGYMGLAYIDWESRYGEVDAVVRGEEAPRGCMTRALHRLIGWARGDLGLLTLGVRVRSDNPALAFYRKAGYRESHRVALRRTEQAREVHWVQDDSGSPQGVSLVFMRLAEAVPA